VRLIHGSYLQDWLLRPEDDNWRVQRDLGGASRAFADIGSHWCDLVEFVTGHRITRLSAQLMTALPRRAQGDARPAFAGAGGDSGAPMRAVSTEDAAVVQFETDGGAIGSTVISQVSAGRKNRLWLEVDCAEEALAFDQENPEQLWSGRRETVELVRRDPETLSPDAARLATLPAGHAQGYDNCFDAFVADVYAAVRGEALADGVPVFADGLRAARVTEAVLRSAAEREWVELPAPRDPEAESPA
jgi:predicted dehydrogenase